MLQATPVHAESARYSASLLFLPELWAPARVWLPAATFFGHRGWEGQLVELRDTGALAGRAAALIEHARRLPHAPVVIGHGAGALVALEAARAGGAAAIVLVAPLVPGSPGARMLTHRWDAIAALALGRAIPPPRAAAYGETPTGLGVESARAVLDVVRGHPPRPGALAVPALVVAGTRDPLLPVEAAAALASSLGAEFVEIPGGAHWPMLPPAWQQTVAAVHRWLVRRLGEALLEFYAEAMADRAAEAGEEDDE